MTAPRIKMPNQSEQNAYFAMQLGEMQRQSAAATAAAAEQQKKEREKILAAEQAAEQARKDEARKKAEAPFIRKSVVTSPFGLLTDANTAGLSLSGK